MTLKLLFQTSFQGMFCIELQDYNTLVNVGHIGIKCRKFYENVGYHRET